MCPCTLEDLSISRYVTEGFWHKSIAYLSDISTPIQNDWPQKVSPRPYNNHARHSRCLIHGISDPPCFEAADGNHPAGIIFEVMISLADCDVVPKSHSPPYLSSHYYYLFKESGVGLLIRREVGRVDVQPGNRTLPLERQSLDGGEGGRHLGARVGITCDARGASGGGGGSGFPALFYVSFTRHILWRRMYGVSSFAGKTSMRRIKKKGRGKCVTIYHPSIMTSRAGKGAQ
jgi:hypothetical protein